MQNGRKKIMIDNGNDRQWEMRYKDRKWKILQKYTLTMKGNSE